MFDSPMNVFIYKRICIRWTTSRILLLCQNLIHDKLNVLVPSTYHISLYIKSWFTLHHIFKNISSHKFLSSFLLIKSPLHHAHLLVINQSILFAGLYHDYCRFCSSAKLIKKKYKDVKKNVKINFLCKVWMGFSFENGLRNEKIYWSVIKFLSKFSFCLNTMNSILHNFRMTRNRNEKSLNENESMRKF